MTTNIAHAQDLAGAIRARRNALGYTQASLALLTGICRPNICRIEAGKHTPTIATLTRLCAALGVTVSELFGAVNDHGFTKSG